MAVFIELQHNAIDILKNKNITIALDRDKPNRFRLNHTGRLCETVLDISYHWVISVNKGFEALPSRQMADKAPWIRGKFIQLIIFNCVYSVVVSN